MIQTSKLPRDTIYHYEYDGKENINITITDLIRCRDCKHWYKDADSGMSCEYTEMSQPEDGFCNWAELRGEEE